ncbi:hypothetical protein SISSUDRAFT_1055422 [Sistotremastrum suecicum HHB10207 ss-3]|uniref:Uncharacterized protein n=1 Tax=Sistotremastrum suecicum HHB10207 ss-3 TaxID=1314776 RepID=A0A165XSZ1_9AGAM|nr:hypothetical protein SISSUDRAFT_1055422 [Sistotremastrum suecicum HHB10207 ss-3]
MDIHEIEHNSSTIYVSEASSDDRRYIRTREPDFTVAIFCFSVVSRRQLREIISRGVREQMRWGKKHANIRGLLVGIDIEKRSDPDVVHRLYAEGDKSGPVLPEEGERVARQLDSEGPMKYMECSLDHVEQVRAVLHEAIRQALIPSSRWEKTMRAIRHGIERLSL